MTVLQRMISPLRTLIVTAVLLGGMVGDAVAQQVESGTVKWFNEGKGFGFIVRDSDGADVFVHISAVEASGLTTLNDGDKVLFAIEQGRDGRQAAMDIVVLE